MTTLIARTVCGATYILGQDADKPLINKLPRAAAQAPTALQQALMPKRPDNTFGKLAESISERHKKKMMEQLMLRP